MLQHKQGRAKRIASHGPLMVTDAGSVRDVGKCGIASSWEFKDTERDRPAIAIVEDNPADVFLIKAALASRHLNVVVYVVNDGDRAVALIEEIEGDEGKSCPQLMLLDINLPKRTGFEVLERLRHSKKCSRIPVLIMSSSGAAGDKEKSESLNANGYFKKPSGYEEFMRIGDIVRQLLAQRCRSGMRKVKRVSSRLEVTESVPRCAFAISWAI